TRPDIEAARAALAALRLPGDARLEAITSGHVNESWHVHVPGDEVLLQWLNHGVFPEADAVQDNVETVLDHLDGGMPRLAVPTLRRAVDGARRVRCESGLWRAFAWLPGRVVHAWPGDAALARAAGVALGAALHALGALPADRIRPVLARFHDLEARLDDLDEVRSGATAQRLADAAVLLARVDDEREARRKRAPLALPPRVLHGDPKFTNFLFPATGTGAVALVDWDTVMVGPLAWDLGDFLRSAACRGGEDDPGGARVDAELLCAGASGFLEGLAEPLASAERSALVAAPAHMAFMLAVRFLTDHLAGDRYFRVRRPRQNLDRASAQLALVDGFDAAEDVLRRLVEDTDSEE
ncbi:MAG: phosphotransferase, partial [Pseudomonadales bacterium]|nr:phosphotransferase [Pseudomonadales bacterium]